MVSGDRVEKKFLIESIGGGFAVIDYNHDGWMDLYVANGGTIESPVPARETDIREPYTAIIEMAHSPM